jgi:hypothetical protein
MFVKTFLATTVCGLIAMLTQPMSMAATAPSLAGSWQFSLTPTTTSTPGPISGLATFTTDGSVIETDTSEIVPGLPSTSNGAATYGSPGHGIWQVGPAVINLYIEYISLVANADGSLNAKNVTTMIVTMDSTGSQFTGTYTTTEASTSGLSKTTSGSVKGQLIPHPALP